MMTRILQVLGGLLLGWMALFCAMSGVMLIASSYEKHPFLGPLVGAIVALLGLWLLAACVRLVLNRRRRGGLFSPFALRFASFIFLALPVGGLFTGYYLHDPVFGVIGAAIHVLIFFNLQRLARQRESALAINPNDPLIMAGVTMAQATLPLMRSLWERREGALLVKFPFDTDSGETEHIWGELLAIEEPDFRASVESRPLSHDGDMPEVVTVPLSDLEDWILPLPDGSVRGGYRSQAEVAYCKLHGYPVPKHMQQMRFVDA